MANWCSTQITINHESNEELKNLADLIEDWISHNYQENGFGLSWLGNVVGNSGVGTVDTGLSTDLCCKGYIDNLNLLDSQLIIHTETAWEPALRLWVKVLEKYLPDAELIYTAEECGSGIFSTNDQSLVGRYYIDSWDAADVDSDFGATEEATKAVLQRILNSTETDIDKLLTLLTDSEYADKMSIHAWSFEELSIWD